MELVYILNALWRKRWLVAIGVVIGALAAISVLFRVSLSPPALHDKTVRVGGATTEILIDGPKSTLGHVGGDIPGLTSRTGIFTRFLTTEGATEEIARESGIPESRISIAGPALTIDGVPDAKTAERVSKLGTARDYILQVQQGSELPVLQIFTQAPTEEGAGRLADASASALANVVKGIQKTSDVPEKRRLVIRKLGNTRSGAVTEKPSYALAAFLFLGIGGFFCLAIISWPAIAAAWRAEQRAERLLPTISNGNSSNGHAPHRNGADHAAQSVEAILMAALTAADRIREEARRDAEAGGSDGDGERPMPPPDRQLGP